jgi:hypothetical protein
MAEDPTIMDYVDTTPTVDLLGTISYNCFRGTGTPQLSIQEFVIGNEIIRTEPEELDVETEETR